MQKNAGEKTLRWLGKTNSRSKNSTPAVRCQAETGKFAEVNFSVQETICILYTAKPLTFLPERSILFTKLVMNNRKEVLHDTRRILGGIDPLSGYKPWGRLCVLFEKRFA
ncbi:MAG: hypothetical protein ACLTV3_10510 [Faecalibacterium prausnitzii]